MTSKAPARAAVIIDEMDMCREEPPRHGEIGMSTVYRISLAVAEPRTIEFHKRVLHPGTAIGLHEIKHEELYYVLDGEGEVSADGVTSRLRQGVAAYLFTGSVVGIRQTGAEPLTLIVSYPNPYS